MSKHLEFHRSHRVGWLRAAVMGANDGIVSTASLIIGIAAAGASLSTILLSGLAGLVSGAMSMAAGEYVSVSSQADTEYADLAKEKNELATEPEHELAELQGIYIGRGLTPELAMQVAQQLTAHDALGAHARDELGISATTNALSVQAAFTSAASFALGAALPLAVAALCPWPQLVAWVAATSLIFLASLGALAAYTGGANAALGAARVAFWGIFAMAATAAVGHWFGVLAA